MGDEEDDNATVFVRNIAFDVTNQDLESFFGDVAPVRRAFIVEQNGKSRGFGFVQFVTSADAQEAVSSLNGSELQGRNIKLELAAKKTAAKKKTKKEHVPTDEKAPEPEAAQGEDQQERSKLKKQKKRLRPEEQEPENGADQQTELTSTKKPRSGSIQSDSKTEPPRGPRTIVITGFSIETTKTQLKHRVKKLGTVQELDLTSGDTPSARVLFESAKDAEKAVKRLHEHIFKGSTLCVERVKDPNPKAGRLIIRNLAFQVVLAL